MSSEMTFCVCICMHVLLAGGVSGSSGRDLEPAGPGSRVEDSGPHDMGPVTRDHIIKHVQYLASLESRHITHPGNLKAEQYITRELEKYGYAPTADGFELRDMTLRNVLSSGSDKSQPAILLTAHFDSTARAEGELSPQAPGADDNASGVAVLLELARILKEKGTNKNVEFVFFNAEEVGTVGSRHLSNEYKLNQWPIKYVINVDTVGTWKGPLSEECPVNYVTDAKSAPVIELLRERFPYPLRKATTMWRDDHARFWDNGFKAIELTEDGCTPHMHKPTDTAEKLHYDNITRIAHGLYRVLCE